MPLASTRTLHRGHALDKSRLLHACLKHALPNHPSVSGNRLPRIDIVKQHTQMTGESDNFACHGEADLSRSPLHYSISCEFVLRAKTMFNVSRLNPGFSFDPLAPTSET